MPLLDCALPLSEAAAAHRIEVSESKPFVQIAQAVPRPLRLAQSWFGAIVPQVRAELVLPQAIDQKLTLAERRDVRRSVTKAMSAATGKEGRLIGPSVTLNGRGALSYFARVRIIETIEKEHGISIPDEHWRSTATVRDLMEYVERWVLLKRTYPQLKDSTKNWPALRQSLPPEQRPVYRRSWITGEDTDGNETRASHRMSAAIHRSACGIHITGVKWLRSSHSNLVGCLR